MAREERKDWARPKSTGLAGRGGMPDWIARDKQVLAFAKNCKYSVFNVLIMSTAQVLRFQSYFSERVLDQGVERERLRSCHILHYLEDETTQVVEPTGANTGILQGRLMTCHIIGLSSYMWF